MTLTQGGEMKPAVESSTTIHGSLAEARSVVVFRALQLGDMLCAVPALRALRQGVPHARITLIGLPWAADFAKRFSHYVDDFLAFPGHPGFPERLFDPSSFPPFLLEAQRQGFDTAIQMHGNGHYSNAVVALLGASTNAGFCTRDACPDPVHFLRYPEEGHEINRLLRLTDFLGCPARGTDLEFPLDLRDYGAAARVPGVAALESGGYACLHPGSRAADKRWAPDRFAAVGDFLAHRGLRIVITGSAGERPLAQAVADAMQEPALNTASDVSVGGLAAILSGARVMVSNCTGVSHIAAALRVPSVIIFSASDPSRWAPLDAYRHRALYYPGQAPVATVLDQVDQVLAAFKPTPAPRGTPVWI